MYYKAIIYHYKNDVNYTHDKNKIVKITNSFFSTVEKNSGNCNLIGHLGCYDCMVTYNVHVYQIIQL